MIFNAFSSDFSMDADEQIQSHVVSIWREAKKFLSIGGREGMLILTDKHLTFVHKTEAKMKWWQAVVPRQTITFMKSKNVMIRHDGYNEENLMEDLENKKNLELSFNDIAKIDCEEKEWGSVINLEYHKDGKDEKFQFAVAQDWVKYPAKEPTKYMKVDWQPFVDYINERRTFVE